MSVTTTTISFALTQILNALVERGLSDVLQISSFLEELDFPEHKTAGTRREYF